MSDQDKDSPANPRAASKAGQQIAAQQLRKRIPMAIPKQKLDIPPIPGYHCHWINDYPGRILQAQQGGYEFISPDEMHVVSHQLGDSVANHGSTDLGTRVSIIVGADAAGQPLRAYAMKIKQEWYDEDQALLSERTRQIQQAIRQGTLGSEKESGSDNAKRYVKTATLENSGQSFPNRRA
jgi:hypothetical protein